MFLRALCVYADDDEDEDVADNPRFVRKLCVRSCRSNEPLSLCVSYGTLLLLLFTHILVFSSRVVHAHALIHIHCTLPFALKRSEAITAHNIATNTHRARWILYTFTTVVSYRNRSLLKGHSPLALPIRIRIQWKFYALRWIDPRTRTIHRRSFEHANVEQGKNEQRFQLKTKMRIENAYAERWHKCKWAKGQRFPD